jgi:hypothetical protein
MVLTVRNKVGDRYVNRPEKLGPREPWVVEYAIEEIPKARTQRIYQMVLARRKKDLGPKDDDKNSAWNRIFNKQLGRCSKMGSIYRKRETQLAKFYPIHVYGAIFPYSWRSVFDKAEDGSDEMAAYKKWRGKGRDRGRSWADSERRKAWVQRIASHREHVPVTNRLSSEFAAAVDG